MALQGSHKELGHDFSTAYAHIRRGFIDKVPMDIWKDGAACTAGLVSVSATAKVKLTKAEEDTIWAVLYTAIKRDDSKFNTGWSDTDPK